MSDPVSKQNAQAESRGSPVFATTRWSVVLATRESDGPRATAAFERLYTVYWYPLRSVAKPA
jgi:hypothetical protein